VKCPHCDRDLVLLQGQKFCPYCGSEVPTPPKPDVSGQEKSAEEARLSQFLDSESGRSTETPYCPWEDQETLGFFRGIGQTLRDSLLSPEAFFSRMPSKGGLLNPLLYALIIRTTGTLASFMWLFLTENPLLAKLGLSGNTTVVAGLTVPLILFVSVFAEALALHGALFLVGGARKDFEATFRVVCYSSGPELCNVIPVIGGWIGVIWQVFLLVPGLRRVHGISTARSAIAILMPSLVCCGLFVVSVMFLARALGIS
jgi:hypothetical protein